MSLLFVYLLVLFDCFVFDLFLLFCLFFKSEVGSRQIASTRSGDKFDGRSSSAQVLQVLSRSSVFESRPLAGGSRQDSTRLSELPPATPACSIAGEEAFFKRS